MNVEKQDEEMVVDYDTDTTLCCTCRPKVTRSTTTTMPPTTTQPTAVSHTPTTTAPEFSEYQSRDGSPSIQFNLMCKIRRQNAAEQ